MYNTDQSLTAKEIRRGDSRRAVHLHPALAIALFDGFLEYQAKYPNRSILFTTTVRTLLRQADLYKVGRGPGDKRRRVTNVDGVKTMGDHNYLPSHAADVAIRVDGKIKWDRKYYAELWLILKKYGLCWGGEWTSIGNGKGDFPHFYMGGLA